MILILTNVDPDSNGNVRVAVNFDQVSMFAACGDKDNPSFTDIELIGQGLRQIVVGESFDAICAALGAKKP